MFTLKKIRAITESINIPYEDDSSKDEKLYDGQLDSDIITEEDIEEYLNSDTFDTKVDKIIGTCPEIDELKKLMDKFQVNTSGIDGDIGEYEDDDTENTGSTVSTDNTSVSDGISNLYDLLRLSYGEETASLVMTATDSLIKQLEHENGISLTQKQKESIFIDIAKAVDNNEITTDEDFINAVINSIKKLDLSTQNGDKLSDEKIEDIIIGTSAIVGIHSISYILHKISLLKAEKLLASNAIQTHLRLLSRKLSVDATNTISNTVRGISKADRKAIGAYISTNIQKQLVNTINKNSKMTTEQLMKVINKNAETIAEKAIKDSVNKVPKIVGTKGAVKFTKAFKKEIVGKGLTVLSKNTIKTSAKTITKAGSKPLLKKIPFVCLAFGIGFAIKEIADNGWNLRSGIRATGEIGSGIASCFPGIGTAISAGIDVGLAADDILNSKASKK